MRSGRARSLATTTSAICRPNDPPPAFADIRDDQMMQLTCDAFLGGRLGLWQPARGYRAAMDAVLLAAFTSSRAGESVLDIGCGVGAAALCLGARVPGLDLHGLEVQGEYADLARRNAEENDVPLVVHDGDLFAPSGDLRAKHFDHVITNPPFRRAGEGSSPPDEGRRRARVEGDPGLSAWIAAAARRVRPKGRLTLIHRAERLPEILSGMAGLFGGVEVLPVAPRPDRPAGRVLVRGRKGSSAQFVLHSPLTIHERSAHIRDAPDYTERAEKILRHMQELLPDARLGGNQG